MNWCQQPYRGVYESMRKQKVGETKSRRSYNGNIPVLSHMFVNARCHFDNFQLPCIAVYLHDRFLYWISGHGEPTGDPSFLEFPPTIIRQTEGITLLGSPVWGSQKFIQATITPLLDVVYSLQTLITDLNDPQIELHLLRSCLSTCKVSHLLCTVPFENIGSPMKEFDQNQCATLGLIMHYPRPISDQAWLQATLSLRLGGLGLREAFQLAPITYISSVDLSHSIANVISSTFQSPFVGEVAAFSHLSSLFPDLPPSSNQALMQTTANHSPHSFEV